MGTKGRVPHLRPKSLYPRFHFYLAGLCPEKLANKGRREEGEPFEGKKITLCGSKNYPYLHHGRDFSLDPPPLWKFQSSFIHLLKIFGPLRTPHPQEFPVPSVGVVWILLGLNIVVTKKRFKKG